MKIYIITHKDFDCPSKSSIYAPLLVGADFNHASEVYIYDNSDSDNISYKNKNYCELTGLYWIWKHSAEDIVGICHYRRYFVNDKRQNIDESNLLNEKEIQNLLKESDIVLPKKEGFYGYTARQCFEKCHHDRSIWKKLRKILEVYYPEFIESLDWLSTQTSWYNYNMCIMNKDEFDSYCEWVFDVLSKIEKQIHLWHYDKYNQRMFGFISERLLNVWVHQRRLRVSEKPVYFVFSLPSLKWYEKIFKRR